MVFTKKQSPTHFFCVQTIAPESKINTYKRLHKKIRKFPAENLRIQKKEYQMII